MGPIMEVGLGPSDIVLDGDPAPPTQRGTAALPNFFGPCLLGPIGWVDQDDHHYCLKFSGHNATVGFLCDS